MNPISLSVRDMLSPSLLKAASPDTLRRALQAGATVLARDARLSWKEPARRPGPWAPLAPSTVARKGHDKILYDTGRLRDSLTLGDVTASSAAVGTDAPYSLYHQTGTKSMSARPFIPANGAGQLTAQAEAEADRTYKLHFRGGGGIPKSRITGLLSSRARAGREGKRFRRAFFDARR